MKNTRKILAIIMVVAMCFSMFTATAYATDEMITVCFDNGNTNWEMIIVVYETADGTLTSARDFSRLGVNVIGVPKTMDNDLSSTDITYGFTSAYSVGTEFIDRLTTTARSHHRVICCELMGRDAGWISLYAGLAGNAAVCLIPEIPFTIENIAKKVAERDALGIPYTVVAVAEGAKYADGTKVIGKIVEDSPDPIRLGGIAAKVAEDLEKVVPNHEVRSVNPGHIIRGGDISAYDRILSVRYGVAAADLINEGKFGNVVTINGDKTLSIDEKTFKASEVSDIEDTFVGSSSFSKSVSSQASFINDAATREATKANTYTSSGSYSNNFSTGDIFTSLF